MTEEKLPSAVELFIKADEKIDAVRQKAEHLMAEDLELKHKMDLVIQRQDQLKERFEHSSTTGHKTWEAVQKILGEMERFNSRVTIVEASVVANAENASAANKKYDRLIFATVLTACVSLVVVVVVALVKFSARF